MSANWKKIRTIVESQSRGRDHFLTVIRGDGSILSANTNLMRTLHLKEEDLSKRNFLQLIHPFHLQEFQQAMKESREQNIPYALELSLKNGYYHPMKWQVNALPDSMDPNTYLCIGQKILDDKRVVKFIKLGEKNYQEIMEGIDQAVIFHDADGGIIAANCKVSELLETTLEDIYNIKDIRSAWDNEWTITDENGVPLAFEEAPFFCAARTGFTQDRTLVVKLTSGHLRWIHYHCQPLFEHNGNEVYAVISNLTDVTEEKNLSFKLEEREAFINQFIKQTPNLAWVVDEETRLVFASTSFFKYFNLDPATVMGEKINEIVPKEVADALYKRHLEVLETSRPLEVVEKSLRADGNSYVFHINIFPIEGVRNRRLLGGHAVSLSEKFAVEKKLREANDRLLLLTRATTDAIWEWDMQTGHIFRNDALMDMIGYQLDNPKGLSWWLRRIHPDDRNRISDIVKESTDNGRQSWEDEYRFKCADGTYKIMRDQGYIVYENGLPVKMIGSLQDVTSIRELENKLMEEKLQRQKELSETVIRVQEKERTRIGHELHDNVNQILSTTQLFVDMINPEGEDQQMLKEKSVSYIRLAIEEIRKLSRELVTPHFREQGLVESIHNLVEDIHLSTRIRVKFTHDHETDRLSQGIRITLFRIVQEQLKNILTHSRATAVDICLDCRKGEVHLEVRDNGVGFDAALANRGIGLSNIHERTKFYNGTVNIKSSPGNGCILEVIIPAI
jgi:PAS domain S-box-containing protein